MLDWVTDGGLETDLLFHHGIDLPEFAAFPLIEQPFTAEILVACYRSYAAIANEAGAGLVLETPTWRANPIGARNWDMTRKPLTERLHPDARGTRSHGGPR